MTLLKRYPILWILSPLLFVLSALYWIIARVRFLMYKKGILRLYKLSAPVVSVGGIEFGGAGKTPFVIYLVEQFQKRGFTPVVLSRGYRRKVKGTRIVKPNEPWYLFGDEPVLIARRLPGSLVVVDRDRIKAAKLVVDELENPIFILDDGAQYLKLHRDVEILLVNTGSRFMFPVGELRDGRFRLVEAQFILYKNNPVVLHNVNAFVSKFTLRESGIISQDFQALPLDFLNDKKLFAFTGIAHPEEFSLTLSRYNTVAVLPFPDHYDFTKEDARRLSTIAKAMGADIILTTEKDLVKLTEFAWDPPIYALRVSVEVENETEFLRLLYNEIEKSKNFAIAKQNT